VGWVAGVAGVAGFLAGLAGLAVGASVGCMARAAWRRCAGARGSATRDAGGITT